MFLPALKSLSSPQYHPQFFDSLFNLCNYHPQFFDSVFNLCKTISITKQLHAQLIINGLYQSVFFGSKLTNIYIELGSLENAHQVFDQIPLKNPYAWNTIIAGYSKNNQFYDILALYKQMRSEKFPADSFNLAFAIKACAGLSALEEGKSFHCNAIQAGLENDFYVAPALINMYVKVGCVDDARQMFDEIPLRNSIVWGCMIKGYLQYGREDEVFNLFFEMKKLGFELDQFSAVGLVQACGVVGAGREGKVFHGFCLRRKFMDSNAFLQTSIVDMYAKCNLLDYARKLFDEIPHKDVVLWSAMVSGFTRNGQACEALCFFRQMSSYSVMPNMVTLSSALSACSHLGALQQGRSIHGFVSKNNFDSDVVINTAEIDMYAKCGCINVARNVFDKMPKRNVFSWSAMIAGYGMHGLGTEALAVFASMISEGLMPNSITFVSVLSACSHSGMVEEGLHYFKSMSIDYGISPLEEHYACMVDLLGRAGRIKEAKLFIENMPLVPGASVWGALLGACRIHKQVELAEQAAEKLFVLESDRVDAYLLLSNTYATAGMWEAVNKKRIMVREKRLQKTIGFSSIEIKKKIYVFSVKDALDNKNKGILELLWVLSEQMRTTSYEPNTNFLLYEAEGSREGDLWAYLETKYNLSGIKTLSG